MKKEQIIQGGAVTLPQFPVQTILLDFDGSVFAWTVQDGAFKSQLAVK